MSEHKDPTRVAAGLKASIHNPHVSDEAKHSAHERLEQMGALQPEHHKRTPTEAEVHEQHVIAGYKAALHNDNVSEQAKAHAREILEAIGYIRGPHTTEEEHQIRVLAGYKARCNVQIPMSLTLLSCMLLNTSELTMLGKGNPEEVHI